jgi:hypothetical protein
MAENQVQVQQTKWRRSWATGDVCVACCIYGWILPIKLAKAS